jgi:hypothetical protein
MADASILDQEDEQHGAGSGTDGGEMHHQGDRARSMNQSGNLIEKQQAQVAAAGTICEGFLCKRKSPAKSGKRVWAVLKVESLYIFKQPGVRFCGRFP